MELQIKILIQYCNNIFFFKANNSDEDRSEKRIKSSQKKGKGLASCKIKP